MNPVESLAGLLGHLANTISHVAGIGQSSYSGPQSMLSPTSVNNLQPQVPFTQGGNTYNTWDFPQGGGPNPSVFRAPDYQLAPGYAQGSNVNLPNGQQASRYVTMQTPLGIRQVGPNPIPGPGVTYPLVGTGPSAMYGQMRPDLWSNPNYFGNAPISYPSNYAAPGPSVPWQDMGIFGAGGTPNPSAFSGNPYRFQ